jgi:hypothetical protein
MGYRAAKGSLFPADLVFPRLEIYESYRCRTAEVTPMTNNFAMSRTGVRESVVLELKEEISDMALLDSIIDANFSSERAGRVVTFPGSRRHRGCLVKSAAEELKIRSFLKMFYFAQFSILLLGYVLASELSRELSYALGRPSVFLFRTVGIAIGMYALVLGVPYWLLWRSYKMALLSFVSAEDEVVVSGKSVSRRPVIVGAGLIALAILTALGVMFLKRGVAVAN